MSLQAPRGTYDLLPEQATRYAQALEAAEQIFTRAGYRPVATPIFEQTELFTRGVGQATDIVAKEMYTFEDKGGRSLSLRPEGTASICRAYIEHGMHKRPQPVKLFYSGPMFRYETPQSGRYRQHYQVGVEVFGSANPLLDAELIALQAQLVNALSIDADLALSSMGDSCCRGQYVDELRRYLLDRRDALSEAQIARIEQSPLRAFDWQEPAAMAVTDQAPGMVDRLCSECASHLDRVRELLDAAGIAYTLDRRLVRGLDYYTRTVFEFRSPRLGAQSGVGGGGRYDCLVKELGGPATPAAGWAMGLDRALLAQNDTEQADASSTVEVFVTHAAESAEEANAAFVLTAKLRAQGIRAEQDCVGRSLKAQLKHADRLGARFAVAVASTDVSRAGEWIRDMTSGEQRSMPAVKLAEEVVRAVREDREQT